MNPKKLFIKTNRRVVMKKFFSFLLFSVLILSTNSIYAQRFSIGPRITGNLNIFNAKNLTGTWSGIGVGIGPTLDLSFNQHIGMMINLTVFDMRNFSNSQDGQITVQLQNGQQTQVNGSVENAASLSYLTIDPMFKAEFSGFYMVAGPSLGVKLASSLQKTLSPIGGTPQVTNNDLDTKSVVFDIAVGTGYNIRLSEGMDLGTDLMAYIPITDTYNFVAQSNSVFSIKLGAALKFRI
jgi:hypothetical protein